MYRADVPWKAALHWASVLGVEAKATLRARSVSWQLAACPLTVAGSVVSPAAPGWGLTLGVVPGTHDKVWDMIFLGLEVFRAHRTARLKPGRVWGKPRALPGLSNLRQQQRPRPLTPA